jgi:hypothetical protein
MGYFTALFPFNPYNPGRFVPPCWWGAATSYRSRPQHVPEAGAGLTAAGQIASGLPVNQHSALLPQPDPPRRCPIRIIPPRYGRLVVPRVPFVTQVCQLAIKSLWPAAHLGVGACIAVGQPVGLVTAVCYALFALIVGEGKSCFSMLLGVFLAAGDGGQTANGQAGLHLYLGPRLVGLLGAGAGSAQVA